MLFAPAPRRPAGDVLGDSLFVGPGPSHPTLGTFSPEPPASAFGFTCGPGAAAAAWQDPQRHPRLHQSGCPWPAAIHGRVLSPPLRRDPPTPTPSRGVLWAPQACWGREEQEDGCVPGRPPQRLPRKTPRGGSELGRRLQSGPKAPFVRALLGSSAHTCVNSEKLHH